MNIRHITILGDGGWGTTLAIHLARKKYPVRLWGPFPDYMRDLETTRHNTKFLPGIKIPQTVSLTADLAMAVTQAELLVLALPSQYVGSLLTRLKGFDLHHKAILSVIKGIDTKTLLRMSETITQTLGKIPLAVLSGPTIAMEVAQGIPSTAVMASRDLSLAAKLQKIFNSASFRIYTNGDVTGVELGGSLKNVIAIACGVCDGLGFGTNTKAAILTRGLVEMGRLGAAMGAKRETFAGLAGLGDLVTTCFSPQSRNRHVGEELGKGKAIHTVTSSMAMVAEGVVTAKAVYRLSQKYQVDMPISREVYHIIYKRKKPAQAVSDLMTRELRAE